MRIGLMGLWLLVVCIVPSYANEPIVIGTVFPIQESDVLEEIRHEASQRDWQAALQSDKEQWSGLKSVTLPHATEHVVRGVLPTYTLEMDIPDGKGGVIYPKGYQFNPMAYITLPGRIVVIGDKQHLPWVKQQTRAGDIVLTAGGDPYELSQLYGAPVFILEPKMQERLAVEVVPSIVTQVGESLHIEEVLISNSQSFEPKKMSYFYGD